MVRPRLDPSVVHRTPLRDWLRSEGLLEGCEFARTEKDLPDRVKDRVLRTRPGAKAEPTDITVSSTLVIQCGRSESVQPSRMMVTGPSPKEFSRVARHLRVFVHEIHGGKVFVGHHRTTVILGKDRYFEPVSSAASSWIAPLLAPAPMALRVDGTVAVLYADGAHMFSHWMFDLLPKIEVLRRAGWTESNIDYFIINPVSAGFRIETLRTLGIPDRKVIMAEGLLVEAGTVVIPSRIRIGFNAPPWACDFVRDRFGPPTGGDSDRTLKIYVSRALARGRRIRNEETIRGIVEQRGFQTVHAESHTVKDFARLIARAEAIAAPHGAGLANVVFAPTGIKVLEMYGAQLTQEFWLLTSGNGGQHFLLPGKDQEQKYPWQSAEFEAMSYGERNIADFDVDPSDLEHALDLMDQPSIDDPHWQT